MADYVIQFKFEPDDLLEDAELRKLIMTFVTKLKENQFISDVTMTMNEEL